MQKSLDCTISKTLFKDKVFFNLCKLSTIFVVFVIISFFSYIIFKASLGIRYYGLKRIFGSLNFNINKTNADASFFAPLIVTICLALFVVLISLPFSIKCSVWLTFTKRKKTKKFFLFWIQMLAVLPSILFGMYAKNHIGPFLTDIFKFDNSSNLFVAGVALIFITSPTVIILLTHAMKEKKELIYSAYALGLKRIDAIYKLVIPGIKKTVLVAMTIILGRVFSESVALNFLLANENYGDIFYGNFFGLFSSKLSTISSLIADNFFADGSGENTQNLLFCFGFLSLIFVLSVNKFILYCGRMSFSINEIKKKIKKVTFKLHKLIPIKICSCNKKNKKKFNLTNSIKKIFFKVQDQNYSNINRYIIYCFKNKKKKNIHAIWKKLWENISMAAMVIFFSCIFLSIIFKGFSAMSAAEFNFWSTGQDTLLRALINTAVIIYVSLFFVVIISFLVSAFLSEYMSDSKRKRFVQMLLNLASSTPAIIFGAFGLAFFLYGLGLSSSGSKGKSLLAGIMTISLFISSHLIKSFTTYFSSVSKDYRNASYALGLSKFSTFIYIIFPIVKQEIFESIIAIMGRIAGETAPLFLTAGLNSMPFTHLYYPGQTLTTRIYSQLFVNNLENSSNKMYQAALLLLIIEFLLLYITKYLWPLSNTIKNMTKTEIKECLKIKAKNFLYLCRYCFYKIFLLNKKVYIV